jgi:hypothetical protein
VFLQHGAKLFDDGDCHNVLEKMWLTRKKGPTGVINKIGKTIRGIIGHAGAEIFCRRIQAVEGWA